MQTEQNRTKSYDAPDVEKFAKDIHQLCAASGMLTGDLEAVSRIISLDKLRLWPASINKHHNWAGGLIQHTMEVMRFGVSMARQAKELGADIDTRIVIWATLFHDLGKMDDYERFWESGGSYWQKSPHYDMIHHVAKSYQYWTSPDKLALGLVVTSIDQRKHEQVSHCILAHHGRKEYGSPVTPAIKEAWIVHLADMASVHGV